MKIVGKFRDKEVHLDEFYMRSTYDGWLCGPSEKRRESANQGIIDDLRGKDCTKIFGDHKPRIFIEETKGNLKDFMPPVVVFASLTCFVGVRGGDEFSHLIIIWLQNKEDDPFEKLSDLIKQVDWEKHAENFMY